MTIRFASVFAAGVIALGVAAGVGRSPAVHAADPGIKQVASANDVKTTADKLETILKSKGVTVFARVDHAAGARKVGKTLRPTVLLIFGNPKLGTPLMQQKQSIGLDLPLKALIYQAENGKTYISYNDPAYLSKRHGVADREKVLSTMSSALKNFTAAAAKK